MSIAEILNDKSIKPKEKTESLSRLVLDHTISIDELIGFADTAKDPAKATCIEVLEFASRQQPDIIHENAFRFVTAASTAKAPRIKWESAKVIGNTASLFPAQLDEAIRNLLANTEHEGTVVRWSAAFALGEILKLKTSHNEALLPAITAIAASEEKNSIKKIYHNAIKKAMKQTHIQ